MTQLRTDLSELYAGVRGTLRPEHVRKAAARVEAEGVTDTTVRDFVDTFQDFSAKGYAPADTRRAYEKAFLELVQSRAGLEVNSPAAVLNEPALTQRLGDLQALITERRTEISELESTLRATRSRISSKQSTAASLLQQKEQYQRTLQRKQEDNRNLLLFAAFGAFGAASTAVGLGAGLNISQLQSEISRLDREIASTRADTSSLEREAAAFQQRLAALGHELSVLQTAETSLTAVAAREPAPTPADTELSRLVQLRQRVEHHQALADNLQEQIHVLTQMNGAASAFEGRLDTLIADLRADVAVLEVQIEDAERALMETALDLVFAESGISPKLDVGPFKLETKRLLLDGLPYLNATFEAQLSGVVERMVSEQLVSATGSRALAAMISQKLRGGSDEAAREAGLSALRREALGSLSEAQRFLLSSVQGQVSPGEARDLLVREIIERAELTDLQARTVSALLADGGTPTRAEQARDQLGEPAPRTRAAAAQRVLDATFERYYGADAPDHTWEDACGEIQALLRRTRALLEPHTAAYRALDLTLTNWELSTGDWTQDQGILRTGLVAAQALARPSMAKAGTEARRNGDHVRAIEDALSLLGAGHPVARSLQRGETRARGEQDPDQARTLRAQAIEAALAKLEPA